jgi:O-antigen/teichoic acid export membrane protein
MSDDRPGYGPLVATASAAMLAVSVFLPWYGVSLTANGTAYFQQETNTVVSQWGNAALQSQWGAVNARVGGLAGHQLATLSGHQALKYTSIVLLLLGGVAFVLALLRLVDSPGLPSAKGSSIVGLGVLATICVLFRMGEPPSAPGQSAEYFSLSLHYGAWLALVSSLGVVLGSVGPRGVSSRAGSARESQTVWSELSGWTPDA